MKYEVRMTIDFRYRDKQGSLNGVRRSTIIDYVDAKNVAEAYINAARNKLSIALDVTKEMKNTSRWGGTIDKVSISLDAVVAKPELENVSFYPVVTESIVKKLSKLEEQRRKKLDRVMYYLEDARKRIEDYLSEGDVHEAPAPNTPRPSTPNRKHICLHCGKEFKPKHKKQRLCNKCL